LLAEHYSDRNNRALGNQLKKKVVEKKTQSFSFGFWLAGFAHAQLLLPFGQPADKFSLVFLQLYWEGTA